MKPITPQFPVHSAAVGHGLGARSRRRWPLVALAAATLLLGATAPAQGLKPQPIGTYARLLQILKEHQPQNNSGGASDIQISPNPNGNVIAFAANANANANGTSASYSQTLVQVAGVDEADPVKNDGRFIYQLDQNRVSIIRAHPDSKLALVKVLDFNHANFSACGLFLDSRFLVVVGTASRAPIAQPLWRKWARQFPFPHNDTVQARVYDITDPDRPRKVREIEIDGTYVGARKIGSTLYLVSRHYPLCYVVNFQTSLSLPLATPGFRDSRRGPGFRALGPQCCYYLPEFYDPSYLVVAGVDLANGSSSLCLNAYLGAGSQLYASLDNLYLTASSWPEPIVFPGPIQPMLTPVGGGLTVSPGVAVAVPTITLLAQPEKTQIYKFSLGAGKPSFVAATCVPGTVLNSYSMDENNGYLRVATTGNSWFGLRTNQLFVLDPELNLTGKLENIAPGEKIYSARFLSNRLFLVTFRQIDPLFAIDLCDPAHPVLAGQLTLPGFSNFLLPYDENHLIGLGKEVPEGSMYQQGMKLALFDVSDLANPTLLSSVSIGDRGTDSPALQDPHALLFDPSCHLLAFPITVAVATNSVYPWQYGDTVFQGAYVFKVSPEAGFEFRGSVTHIREGSNNWGDPAHQIGRLLTIGTDLFTLSSAQVRANDLDTLAEKGVLRLR